MKYKLHITEEGKELTIPETYKATGTRTELLEVLKILGEDPSINLYDPAINFNLEEIEDPGIRTDIARTLEGIDVIAQNRYLKTRDLEPIADILHHIENRMIIIEKQADPNRKFDDEIEDAYYKAKEEDKEDYDRRTNYGQF